MDGPQEIGWLTARGLENEETSLIERAEHAGLDISAILRNERHDACVYCREARETGHHKNLRIISHEETQCHNCGAYYFAPDD